MEVVRRLTLKSCTSNDRSKIALEVWPESHWPCFLIYGHSTTMIRLEYVCLA